VVLAAGALAITPATAGKFLTKKRALKLFYTKAGADAQFVDPAEVTAATSRTPSSTVRVRR